MNYMEQVAEMLGVELKEVFYLYRQGRQIKCKLTRYGIKYQDDKEEWVYKDGLLTEMLTGQYKIKESPWKPAERQNYFIPYISSGEADFTEKFWFNLDCDEKRYEAGFVCRTPAEATKKAEKMLAALKEEII